MLKVCQRLVVVDLGPRLAAFSYGQLVLALEHQKVLRKSRAKLLLFALVLCPGRCCIGLRGLVAPPGSVHRLQRISHLDADLLDLTPILRVELPSRCEGTA